MITTIIFDWGGVFSKKASLREFCEEYAQKHRLNSEAMQELIIKLWLNARLGKNEHNFFDELATFANTTTKEFKEDFFPYFELNNELLEFVKEELVGNYKLGILSNNIRDWFEPIIKELDLHSIFDVIVTSYNTQNAKPDLKIFKIALQEFNENAQHCIYIDDLSKNIPPAKELGFHVIQFKNTQQCIESITRMLNELD